MPGDQAAIRCAMKTHLARRLLQLLLFSTMLLALVPFRASVLNLGNLGDLNVDVAFQLALPYFLEQHLQFGEQIVFTYGPWGILLGAFAGSYYHSLFLVFRVTLVLSIFMGFYVLAGRQSARPGRAVVWGGVIALIVLWITEHRDSYFMFPALLLAYQRLAIAAAADRNSALPIRRGEALLLTALSLLCGWLALAKFSIFVVATVAHLIVLADDVYRRRRPLQPVAYAGALVVAWMAAGQDVANLPLWVWRCLDLSNGYADAMSKGFFVPYGVSLVAVYYAAVVFIALAALAASARHRWRPTAMLSLLFTLFLCAIATKHGIGGNQLEQSLTLLIAVVWFVGQPLFLPSAQCVGSGFRGWCGLAACSAVAAILCLTVLGANISFPVVSFGQALINMRGNGALLTSAALTASTDPWDASLAEAHRFWQPTTEPVSQTIDVYPHYTGVVIGRAGLRYVPRPAFLSLNAHTFDLAMLNASHLEGPNAPNLILFQVLPRERAVNNRLPSLADGPSWPLLLSRYGLEDSGDEFLLLKKRASALPMTRKLLLDASLQLGDKVVLPQGHGNLIWAELELKRSAVGDIVHALYKSPHMLMESRTADGEAHVFQIVPELGKAGFLMSPLVKNNAGFAGLYGSRVMTDDVVRSITISSPEAPAFLWESKFRLKLYALKFNSCAQSS